VCPLTGAKLIQQQQEESRAANTRGQATGKGGRHSRQVAGTLAESGRRGQRTFPQLSLCRSTLEATILPRITLRSCIDSGVL
jgi:hypothetical protein